MGFSFTVPYPAATLTQAQKLRRLQSLDADMLIPDLSPEVIALLNAEHNDLLQGLEPVSR